MFLFDSLYKQHVFHTCPAPENSKLNLAYLKSTILLPVFPLFKVAVRVYMYLYYHAWAQTMLLHSTYGGLTVHDEHCLELLG